jgi:hypothetical protein
MKGKSISIVVGVLLVAALGLGAVALRLASREETPMYTPTEAIEIATTDAEVAARTETATFAMG